MPYTTQTWVPGAGGGTPLGATRMNHIESGLADHEARIAAVETDSGWVNVTVAGAYTANGTPVVRKIGKGVRANAGITNAGLAINTVYTAVMTIPAGYRPDRAMYQWAGVSTGAQTGNFVINTDGTVDLRTGATLSNYYRLDPCSWFTA